MGEENEWFVHLCPQGYGFRPVYQGEDLQFTCKGLQRVTAYNFRLSATNEKGQGPSSPSVTYHTLPDIPKPPGAPTLKERATPTSLYIEWQPPTDDGGSPVQSYVLQMDDGERDSKSRSTTSRDSGSPALADAYTGPETSYKAEGLKPGRKYRFQVQCNCTLLQWSHIHIDDIVLINVHVHVRVCVCNAA